MKCDTKAFLSQVAQLMAQLAFEAGLICKGLGRGTQGASVEATVNQPTTNTMNTTTTPPPDTAIEFSTHLGFSEYWNEGFHLYDGNFEETARGTKEEVIEFLTELRSRVPKTEDSLRWEGGNGWWYSGDEARAALDAEISEPSQDQAE